MKSGHLCVVPFYIHPERLFLIVAIYKIPRRSNGMEGGNGNGNGNGTGKSE